MSDSRLLRYIDCQNDVTKMASWELWDQAKKNPSKYAHILLPDKFTITFYTRPVLAFEYCCWLRLSVCVSVNHEIVRVNGDNSSPVVVFTPYVEATMICRSNGSLFRDPYMWWFHLYFVIAFYCLAYFIHVLRSLCMYSSRVDEIKMPIIWVHVWQKCP